MAIKGSLPERYPAIIDMYVKGHANSLDILKADFSHWPPQGLDIVNPPDFEVKFGSMYKTLPGLIRFIPTPITIGASLFLGGTLGMTYLAVTTAARVMALAGFVQRGESTIYMNDAYRLLGGFQNGRRFFSHIIAHEFKHVMQGRDKLESLSSAFDERLDIAKKVEEGSASKRVKYLAEECEMQARLHTTLVGAYHQFGEMPTNYAELMAVLKSQNINLPESVENWLHETRSGRAALKKFVRDDALFMRYADRMAISDLNSVVDAIDEKHKESFWQEDIPFVYGDLLELYGDRLGHKRMGHTHNIQLREVFYRSVSELQELERGRKFKGVLKPALLQKLEDNAEANHERAMRSLEHMDAQDASDLACMMMRGDIYKEFSRALLVTPRQGKIGREAIEKIWTRNDLTSEQRGAIKFAFDAFRHGRTSPDILASRRPSASTRRNDTHEFELIAV